ncbi:MAG: permease [Kiritimatiellae bacterium]|nr:permease [Kiritimatiellia bacterium]
MDVVLSTVKSFWNVFAMMAPWLVVGFLAAGVIAVWIPRGLVMRVMGGTSGWKGILRAVLIGVPLPICSCGVLPIAAGLRKHGAGKGPIAAFLISTPQTGVDSILATYALMGPVFAFARPVAAALTGLIGGGAVSAVGGDDASDVAVEASEQSQRGVVAVLRQSYRRLLGSVVKPLLVGLVISALVTVCVPDDFFTKAFNGSDLIAMPVMVLVGFPMYVCSTASIPIAASLVMKGVSPGAAFVFLMVGPAMNAMSVTTVVSLIGKKATAVYVAVIALGAIACGVVINFIPGALPTTIESACSAAEHSPSILQQAAAVFLAVMMAYNLMRPFRMATASC